MFSSVNCSFIYYVGYGESQTEIFLANEISEAYLNYFQICHTQFCIEKVEPKLSRQGSNDSRDSKKLDILYKPNIKNQIGTPSRSIIVENGPAVFNESLLNRVHEHYILKEESNFLTCENTYTGSCDRYELW